MKYRRETYHRAIDIFDRIMAVFDFQTMTKSEIIFIGIFAVFIASKLEVNSFFKPDFFRIFILKRFYPTSVY